MRTVRGIAALALFCLVALTGVSHAKSVYLKDGGILECQWVKRSGNNVVVKVNRDIVVSFSKDEIDLNKTFSHKKKQRVKHDAAAKTDINAESQDSAPAIAPAIAKTQPKAVAKPVPAAKQAANSKPPQQAQQPQKPAPAPVTTKAAPTPPPPVPEPPRLPLKELQAIPAPPPAALKIAAMSPTVLMVALIVTFALVFILIAGNWKVFEKAGVAGWKCLIPIYNVYLMIVIAGKPWWWLLLMLVPIVSVAIYLLTMLALASKFGKGPLFGVGLFFLPIIFFPVLGFDSSEYSG
jgi:hypothetical protein